MTGVRLKTFEAVSRDCVNASVTPMTPISAVSFCRPTKSLSRGGTIRRTACGTMTVRSVMP